MIPYYFYDREHSYWDQTLLKDLLSSNEFVASDTLCDGCIVIVPGANNKDNVEHINRDLAPFKDITLIVTSDEESLFPIDLITSVERKFVMYPRDGVDALPFPIGYTPHTRPNITGRKVTLRDGYFSGQNTHKRRQECVDVISTLDDVLVRTSEGFSQGVDPKDYMQELDQSKIIFCPGGPFSPDSFRLYEALEAGSIPMVDQKSGYVEYSSGFWTHMFGADPAFEVVTEWEHIIPWYKNNLTSWITKSNISYSWWQLQKLRLKRQLSKNQAIGKVSVLIPTSPIPSNPSIDIIKETIESVRHHMPDAEVFIMIDGIKEAQLDKYDVYQLYIQNLLRYINLEHTNIYPVLFQEHMHQAAMTKATIENYVITPLILFVEHDTPLTTDTDIDWDKCIAQIESGKANIVRYHFEAFIPEPHKYMMLDQKPVDGFTRTLQWSQRPHLASTAYYRRILNDYFSPESKIMIEDVMHGIVVEDHKQFGITGWNEHRIVIYTPPGNIKRSYHLDGRESESKYEEAFIK